MSTFEQMIERGHERVCFHHDKATGLRAIIAIHSTKLGNALGGTRRWHYATEAEALYDVLRLSEGMTYKAAVSGLPMGGAKSVILMPSPNHQATEAEARAMGRFVETFSGAYIAAEDVGVNPQFVDWMASETDHVRGGVNICAGGDPSPYTAAGVVNAMKACISHTGIANDFTGLRIAVQGVGNVGCNIVRIMSEAGAQVFVSDINSQRVQRCVNEFGATAISTGEILTTKCDILVPCALGGVLDGNIAQRLQCKIVCGGANNVLDDPIEDAAALRGRGILYAPDFVANAGGLIHLAGLYLEMTPEELNQKITDIEGTMAEILRDGESMSSTHEAAVKVAKQRICNSNGPERQPEKVHAG